MRNEVYEQVLTKEGLEWEYVESVSLTDINMNKSLSNQARLDKPLDEELIADYAKAKKDGYNFPPLVVWRPGKGMWILIDGNNRLAADNYLNRKATDVYVVKNTDPKVIDRLTWRFNNLVNGKRLTYQECMQHAISYSRKYGVSVPEAAKEWGVHQNVLYQKIRLEEGKDILRDNNVKITNTLSDNVLLRLNPLRDIGNDVYSEAVRVVAVSGATSDDVDDLMREVKKAKNVEGKSFVIQEFAKSARIQSRTAETKGGQVQVKPNVPREQLHKLLRKIRNLTENYGVEALRPMPSDMKVDREVAEEVVEHLDTIYKLGVVPTINRSKVVG